MHTLLFRWVCCRSGMYPVLRSTHHRDHCEAIRHCCRHDTRQRSAPCMRSSPPHRVGQAWHCTSGCCRTTLSGMPRSSGACVGGAVLFGTRKSCIESHHAPNTEGIAHRLQKLRQVHTSSNKRTKRNNHWRSNESAALHRALHRRCTSSQSTCHRVGAEWSGLCYTCCTTVPHCRTADKW